MKKKDKVVKEEIDVTVISLTWNSEKYVKRFLDSLLDDLKKSNLSYEIIIIDNGSRDSTLDMLKKYKSIEPNLLYIPLSRNMGTTFSRNIGIRMARGKYVAILDSDTVIPTGTFEKMLEAFNEIKSERIGIIHPKLIYPDGTFQESARRFPNFLIKVARLFNAEKTRKKLESIPRVLREEITTADYAISAAWFLKREIFERVGVLDEKIFYAPEDAEFCARVWQSGLEVWYYPRVTIIHGAQRLTKKRPFSKLALLHLLGLLHFWWKYWKFLWIRRKCKPQN